MRDSCVATCPILKVVAVVEASVAELVTVRQLVEDVAVVSVPVMAVELAEAFLIVSPERSVS